MTAQLRVFVVQGAAAFVASPGAACPFDGDGMRFFAFAGVAGHAPSADAPVPPAAQAPASAMLESVRSSGLRDTDEAAPERSAAPSVSERRASRTWSAVANEMRP